VEAKELMCHDIPLVLRNTNAVVVRPEMLTLAPNGLGDLVCRCFLKASFGTLDQIADGSMLPIIVDSVGMKGEAKILKCDRGKGFCLITYAFKVSGPIGQPCTVVWSDLTGKSVSFRRSAQIAR
jgi:hypothetical protein